MKTEAVAAMLGRLAPVAARARSDRTTATAGRGRRAFFTAADWAFYTEKVRIAKYDVDTAQMRPC
jgi:peptidyl-dipeptidase Dcp